MPSEITVHVTQDDIAHGEKCNCTECPIALAVKRTFTAAMSSLNEVLYVDVTGTMGVHVQTRRKPRTMISWNHEASSTDFIHKFDRGLTVEPFSFTVQIPAWHWFHSFINTEAPNNAVDRPEDR